MNDINSLAHTKWNCKYHIVFAPKYRRKVFYGEKRLEIGAILRSLCEWKKSKYTRGWSVYWPRAYARGNTTQNERVGFYGVFKRKKYRFNIPKIYKFNVEILTQRILVYRILCGYSRKEHKEDKRIYRKSIKRR